jgi:hypothetical protein
MIEANRIRRDDIKKELLIQAALFEERVTGFEPVISTLGKLHVSHYTKPAYCFDVINKL